MGEGWGEGANSNISNSYVTPPLNPLPPGEGKTDFFTQDIKLLLFPPFHKGGPSRMKRKNGVSEQNGA